MFTQYHYCMAKLYAKVWERLGGPWDENSEPKSWDELPLIGKIAAKKTVKHLKAMGFDLYGEDVSHMSRVKISLIKEND